MPNELLTKGTRVVKTKSEPGDTHQDGAQGTVISVLGAPGISASGYFVHWDDLPGIPIFISGRRVRPVEAH